MATHRQGSPSRRAAGIPVVAAAALQGRRIRLRAPANDNPRPAGRQGLLVILLVVAVLVTGLVVAALG